MQKWALLVIITLGFVLRVIGLSSHPAGFTPDEASFGYDAYSIMKTGADQWGHKLPLVLESFGDFKSPLYAYLTIPSVAVFGLNKFAVRLPSAVLGTLSILITYLLAGKLFGKKVGIASAILLAVSPWHISLSRGAFEANLTTFFLPLGVWLFLEKRYKLSGLVFGLNLFSYHTAKFITPVILIALIFYSKDAFKKYWQTVAIFGIFILATIYTFMLGAGARIGERSITQGATEAAFSERIRSNTVFHNKYTVIAKRFLSSYVTYISPQFLFSQGANEGTYGMIPGRGVIYWLTLPFILLAFKKKNYFLLFWLLIAPIPSALATGAGYSANRVAIMMPALEILIAVGAVEFFDLLKNKKLVLFSYGLVCLVSFILFLEDYFVQSPYKIGQSMLSGNLEAAQWANKNIDADKKIIVDKSLSEPHIYFAFANLTDPKLYQESTKSWKYETWVDQIPEYSLGNITFKDIDKDDINYGISVIGRPDDFKFEVIPQKTFEYPSGETAIQIIGL
ncbi:MAG: glycosyltransferase family 39 protein [Patescibacteria group bacterium]